MGGRQSDITHRVPAAGNGEFAHTPDSALPPITHYLLHNCDWKHPDHRAGGYRPASAHSHVLLPGQSVLLGDLLQLHRSAPAADQLPDQGQDNLCSQLCSSVLLLWLFCRYWVLPAGSHVLRSVLGHMPPPALHRLHDLEGLFSAGGCILASGYADVCSSHSLLIAVEVLRP